MLSSLCINVLSTSNTHSFQAVYKISQLQTKHKLKSSSMLKFAKGKYKVNGPNGFNMSSDLPVSAHNFGV